MGAVTLKGPLKDILVNKESHMFIRVNLAPLTHPLTHIHTHTYVHMQYTWCGVELGRVKRYLTLTDAQNCFSFSVSLIQVGGVRSVTLPESLLFVSTLDGSLHAVSKQSGDIKWTLREGSYGSKSRPLLIVT